MSGETEASISGWTVDTYRVHNEAMRHAETKFGEERDRRYKEVAEEREKALKIKEEADKMALGLQRDNQIYKDEKANELREQIGRERLLYATKDDVKGATEKLETALKPLMEFVAAQQGRARGMDQGWVWMIGVIGALGTLSTIGAIVVGVIVFFIKGS